MWNCHELSDGWSPKDSVIRYLEISNLERNFSVRKFSRVPSVTGKLIYPRGIAEVPGISPWNGELLHFSSEREIFMPSRVWAKRMLSPLPPSISTLLSLFVQTMGSSTSG